MEQCRLPRLLPDGNAERGVDECTQRKVLRELKSCFDLVSVEEAAQAG